MTIDFEAQKREGVKRPQQVMVHRNTFTAEERAKLNDLSKSATVVVGKTGAVDYLTTDYGSDNACIQAAIDYVNGLGGGSVLIREGLYTAKFNVEENVDVSGVGNSTIIQLPNTAYNHAIFIRTNSSLKNIKIDGSVRRAGLGDVNVCYIFGDSDIENIYVNNVTFYKTGSAVSINVPGTNNTFENIIVSECLLSNSSKLGGVEKGDSTNITRNIIFRECGFVWESEAGTTDELFDFNGCDDVSLDCCKFIADNSLVITDEAIDMTGIHNRCEITNNKIIANFQRLIKAGYKCRDILIEGNYGEFIAGTTSNEGGIVIWNNGSLVADEHPERVRVLGNHVKGMTGTGITLDGTFRNTIVNNIMEECIRGIKLDKDTYNGADVECQYNSVVGNVIINPQTHEGILVDDAGYNTIIGNTCVDIQGSPTMTYGIYETTNAQHNSYIGNVSNGAVTAEFSFNSVGDDKNNIGNINSDIPISILRESISAEFNQSYGDGAYFQPAKPIIDVNRRSTSRGACMRIGNYGGAGFLYGTASILTSYVSNLAEGDTFGTGIYVNTNVTNNVTFGIADLYLWSDASNRLRMHTAQPSSDTDGQVVGGAASGSITSPAVPSSTANYTNAYGYPCQVQVYGGTVTEIDIDDIATGLTSGIFIIPPGGTINITYSAAPSWRWWGL